MSLRTSRFRPKLRPMGEPRNIGLIGYDGVQALDLVGPSDAFSGVVLDDADGAHRQPYQVFILGLTGKPFRAESGLVFQPTCTLADAPPLDTLIIPGGRALRETDTSARIAEWIKARAPKVRRIASICTGLYGLAPTGLLDGRPVTTHWHYAQDAAQRFPRLDVKTDALYIKSDKFYTSAGVTAGIDLSLAMIEEDFGPAVALTLARYLVVYFKRPDGQEQLSEPHRFPT